MYYELKIRETKTFLLSIIIFIMVLVPLHFMIQAGLSVVTADGCIRDWATSYELDNTYKGLSQNCYQQ